MATSNDKAGLQEKREFFRVHYKSPCQFKAFDGSLKPSDRVTANTHNISQSGLLFSTRQNPPQISSILWLDVDIRTLSICKEIENRALIHKNGIFGKVVRVEETADAPGAYEIGVCFLTHDQRSSAEIQRLLANLS